MEKRKSYELKFKLAVVEHLADKVLDEYEKYVLSRFIHRLNENKVLIQRQ